MQILSDNEYRIKFFPTEMQTSCNFSTVIAQSTFPCHQQMWACFWRSTQI